MDIVLFDLHLPTVAGFLSCICQFLSTSDQKIVHLSFHDRHRRAAIIRIHCWAHDNREFESCRVIEKVIHIGKLSTCTYKR